MKKLFITLILGAMALTATQAQEESKLVVKPSGRILLDAGVFGAQHYNDQLKSGVAIPDMRVGVGFTYGQWKGKVDMGYAYGKVNMKDVWLEYHLNKEHFLRGGYFIHQYGLQSCTSSSFKESMEEPASNQVFNNNRMIGLMYEYDAKKVLATASIVVETDAMKMTSNNIGKQGIGGMTRIVYRPFTDSGKILQVGISGGIEGARYNSDENKNHSSFDLSTTWPTRIAKVTAQHAVVEDAKAMYKFTPEILYSTGRLALEGQYFYNTITRKNDLKNFTGSGAYATIRGLIKGKSYDYNSVDGGLATPKPGYMELVLQYNYTDLSDSKAGIYGGRMNDWSLTYNYYLNKYMIWRVRASWTKVNGRSGFEDNEVSILETRLQFKI